MFQKWNVDKIRLTFITDRYVIETPWTVIRSFFFFLPYFVVMHVTGETRKNRAILSCSLSPGLSYTPHVDFSSFPGWRPQIGSSFQWWFLVWRTWFLYGWRLSEGGPVDFCRWTHQGPVRKTFSGLQPPPWKTFEIDWSYVELSEFINNRVSHTGNRSEKAPPTMSYHAGKPSKLTWSTPPDSTYRPIRTAVETYIV